MGSNKKSCDHEEEEEPTEIVWDHWVKKKKMAHVTFPSFFINKS